MNHFTKFSSIYLQGRKVKRLDKSIDAVMKLSRDSISKRLIKLTKKSCTEKSKKIIQSHKASESITTEMIRVLVEDEEWIVGSSSDSEKEHNVVKVQDKCEHLCLECTVCNICIHTFKCSCTDNLIKLNICKHIHACAKHVLYSLKSDYVRVEAANTEIVNLLNTIRTTSTTNANISNNNRILKKLNLLWV